MLNLGSPSACECKPLLLQSNHHVPHYACVRFSGQAEFKCNVQMQVLSFFILKMGLDQAAHDQVLFFSGRACLTGGVAYLSKAFFHSKSEPC